MMFSKPFGPTSTTTGFGSFGSPQPNANPFAQNQLFNKTPSTTGGFGATQTTFGQQAGTSLFTGQQPQTNLFQNANTPAFGATATGQTGFGTSNLFGQQQQQQASTSGLFGSSTFGQQNKPSAFGFGTPQTQTGIFGQQQGQPQGSSLFQPSTSTNIFGQSTSFGGAGQTGTVIKFNPVTGTDTMQKSGIATSINTKHYCITCMKEYESKSLEELRYEDYLANRKGPQQQSGFGTTPFGAPVSSAPSLFGQTDNKPAFGQSTGFGPTTSAFGQTTGFGLQNQQNTSSSLFGKPTAGFGVASTGGNTFGFATNTTTNVPFGAPQQAKPFGTATQPLFAASAPQQSSGFGSGIFGQTGTQNTAGSSLFGKPTQPATGPTQGFSFPQTTTTTSSLFQQPKMGFNMFGQTTTSTPSYGQTPAFGQPQSTFATGNVLGKVSAFPATPGFGVNFSNSQQNTAPSLFANTQQKPGGFFDTGGSFFTGRNLQQPGAGGFGMQQQQQAIAPFPTADSAESVLLVANTQFPFSPHLSGLTPTTKADTSNYATNRQDLNAILDARNRITTKTPTLKLRPITRGQKTGLFSEEDELFKNYIMNTQKRLIIKKPSDDTSILNDVGEELADHVKDIVQRLQENERAIEAAKESELEEDLAATRSRSSAALAAAAAQKDAKEAKGAGTVEDRDVLPVEEKLDEQPVHHPCGIILTRPEYFTVPPLSEIEQYKNENGTCFVKGFTVGRIGYGNVYFPDVMDVSNLNLDEIVFFRFKEVTVYPDGYPNKPPVGQGLNRRAQITLDHVYPTVHGQQVKDLEKLVELGYIDNLKESCARQGCKFLEYRVESGSWVFESKHFTTYAVDFEDDYQSAPKQRTSAGAAELRQLQGETSATRGYKFSYGMGRMDEYGGITREGAPYSQLSGSFHQRNFVPQRQIEMKRTLYGSELATIRDLRNYVDHKALAAIEGLNIGQYTLESPLIIRYPPAKKDPLCSPPKIFVLQNKMGEVPPEKSLLTGVRSCVDLNIFKGKSFRCGWMRGFKHISRGNEIYLGRHSSSIIHIRDINFQDPSGEEKPVNDYILSALTIVRSEETLELDENGCPTFKVNIGPSYLVRQTELFKEFLDNSKSNSYMIYLSSIWQLCYSLWAPLMSKHGNRKDYVCKWLQETVFKPVVNQWSLTHSTDMPCEELSATVMELLSINCTREAAELLMLNSCPQLSLLVAQLTGTDYVQDLVATQLVSWYRSMAEEFIPNQMKKIYLVLSGNAVLNEVNICENLDWKRAFGMHLWYVAPTHSPLYEAVRIYTDSFKGDESYAAPPLPVYADADTAPDTYDTLYHILLLYTSSYYLLNHVLNPATYTADPLDYRMSWLLLQLFHSLQVGLLNEASENMIIIRFSNQLEDMDEWQWAIYVLLFIQDNRVKERLVREILERNLSLEINEETDEIDDNLVNQMKVPSKWIHRVKAYKAQCSENHWLSYAHFAHAGDYYKSNDIFVEHLLPFLVINEQFDQLKEAIKCLQPYSSEISTWHHEIGLITDFLELDTKFVSIADQDELRRLHTELVSLVKRLPGFPQKNDSQKLCMAEVSRKCALFQRVLVENVDDPSFIHTFIQVMDHLVMPPDYMFIEAMYYFRKLAALP